MKKIMAPGALFLEITPSGVKVWDYESQAEKIHARCGGRVFYVSRTGLTKAGTINSLQDLIPAGIYRVDRNYPDKYSHPLGRGWEVLLPYALHKGFQDGHPVVLKRTAEEAVQLVYCRLDSLTGVLADLFGGGEDATPELPHRELSREFYNFREEKREIVKISLFSDGNRDWGPNPFEFLAPELEPYELPLWGSETHLNQMGLARAPGGDLVATRRILNKRYAIAPLLGGSPSTLAGVKIPGWEEPENLDLPEEVQGVRMRALDYEIEVLAWGRDLKGEMRVYNTRIPKVQAYLGGGGIDLLSETLRGFTEELRRSPAGFERAPYPTGHPLYHRETREGAGYRR